MGRSLDDVIATLPEDGRERVQLRFEELKKEVENLGELRRVAGMAQASIAEKLKIKQPSVSKIEKQADMYLSTLRNYVEAVGGRLELVVRLPERDPIRIERLGDIPGVGTAPAGGTRDGLVVRPRKSKAKAA